MSHESFIKVVDLCHAYDERWKLRLPRLLIERGEVLAWLGPTGAGKSTFLRLLSGLETPRAGEVGIFDERSNQYVAPKSCRGQITMVFQSPLLLSGTVRHNVEFGLRLRQPAARRDWAIEVMDRLGLSGLATQQAARLSGGQQQLVALARALVLRPATLVLDEPTAHLDPATVALVESVIDEENRSRGMTVIWATHNLFQARRVAHRTGLMLQGELVELGPTATLFDSPTSSLTRAFVNGEMIY